MPVVRRSVETQRREVGTARTGQLHEETAGRTDGHQRRGDHCVDLGAGRTVGTPEDDDGGDNQGKGDSHQHEQEGRISRADGGSEQDDRDKRDRHTTPGRSQAGDARAALRFVFRQCRPATRDRVAGHVLSSGFGRRPVSRDQGEGSDG